MSHRSRTSSQKRKRRPTPPRPAIKVAPPAPKRRFRSRTVVIGSIGALFAGLCLYGVFRQEDRTCVDGEYRVISERECEEGRGGAHWYYGGKLVNGKMSGGSFVRGGFGGHSSGGGG